MMNTPDLLPNAAMNQWIQKIMLFDFTLKHVPGRTHLAADALSRRPLAEGETIVEDDEAWLDDISLIIQVSENPQENFGWSKSHQAARILKEKAITLTLVCRISQNGEQSEGYFPLSKNIGSPIL